MQVGLRSVPPLEVGRDRLNFVVGNAAVGSISSCFLPAPAFLDSIKSRVLEFASYTVGRRCGYYRGVLDNTSSTFNPFQLAHLIFC